VRRVSIPSDEHPTLAVPYVLDPSEGEVVPWFAGAVMVKASGPAFDAAVSTETAGSEPPLHVHADDEAIFVLGGSLTVFAGGEVLEAGPHSFAYVPRGVPHTFTVESGSARLLLILAPSGALVAQDESDGGIGAGTTVLGPHPRAAGTADQTEDDVLTGTRGAPAPDLEKEE
jgi:quercetin dioxygenase-like cupin family protein